MAHIGDKIRERRKQLGMTQKELADKMGYTNTSTISKIEKGINDITQSTIVKFSKALDTEITYLLDWDDDIGALRNQITYQPTEVDKIAARLASYTSEELEEVKSFMNYVESKRK